MFIKSCISQFKDLITRLSLLNPETNKIKKRIHFFPYTCKLHTPRDSILEIVITQFNDFMKICIFLVKCNKEAQVKVELNPPIQFCKGKLWLQMLNKMFLNP